MFKLQLGINLFYVIIFKHFFFIFFFFLSDFIFSINAALSVRLNGSLSVP